MVYLDNAATTRQSKASIAEFLRVSEEAFANPSSIHEAGRLAEKELSRAREYILKHSIPDAKKVVFTGSATEANNIIIRGLLRDDTRLKIITSQIEHPSVLNVCDNIKSENIIVDTVSVDKDGSLNLNELYEKIDEDTALVSIQHVNSEVGAIQPLHKISNIIRESNARLEPLRRGKIRHTYFHSDCVQSFSKMDIDAELDFASVSAHKIGGPKGIGALIFGTGIKAVRPFIYGGGQEYGIRSGTENVPAVAAFAEAIKECQSFESDTKRGEIKRYFLAKISEIKELVPILPSFASPYIQAVRFTGFRPEVIVHALEDKGVYVSTGSACSSKAKESHVLKALGYNDMDVVRFSFSNDTTKADIDDAVRAIKKVVNFSFSVKGW